MLTLTQEQYRREMIQKAIQDCADADNNEEQLKFAAQVIDMRREFWTEERFSDYINYITAPDGTICPLCKDIIC